LRLISELSLTNLSWTEWNAAQQVCTLERALQVRHWGSDQWSDELILPYLEQDEMEFDRFLGQPTA